jgi:hypothetical protein
MNQNNNNTPSQWPKALVAIVGIVGICGASYFLKNANVMWSFLLLIWLLDWFD